MAAAPVGAVLQGAALQGAREWRCTCRVLLGKVLPTGEVEIQHVRSKDEVMRYLVRGEVTAWCRRCGEKLVLVT